MEIILKIKILIHIKLKKIKYNFFLIKLKYIANK